MAFWKKTSEKTARFLSVRTVSPSATPPISTAYLYGKTEAVCRATAISVPIGIMGDSSKMVFLQNLTTTSTTTGNGTAKSIGETATLTKGMLS